MNNIADRHFSLNRVLMLAVGLWPYQRGKLARIQSICFNTIVTTSIIFQLATFVTSTCSMYLVIQVFCFAFCYIGSVIIYNSFFFNLETVMYVMEQLQHICDNLKDDNEVAIITRYGKKAKQCTILMTKFYVCCGFIILVGELWSECLNVFLPVNMSRPHHLLITAEYFVNEEKYFYLLLLYFNAAGAIIILTAIATWTLLNAYIQHICGMFKIASYRIEQGINVHMPNGSLLNRKLCYQDLIYAVDIHRKAMMLTEHLISRFQLMCMLLLVIGVPTISCNFFRIFYIISSQNNIGELLIFLAIAFLEMTYTFLANLMGQEIIDHNNNIYNTVYEVRWYKAPLCIQRVTLFLLQRGNKSFALKIGGVFVGSLQSFTMVVNTSLSYFTVMYSVQ